MYCNVAIDYDYMRCVTEAKITSLQFLRNMVGIYPGPEAALNILSSFAPITSAIGNENLAEQLIIN